MDLATLLNDLLVPGVSVVEKIIRPLLVYVFLVFILRIGGRRELGQWTPFDLVVLLTVSNAVQNAIIGADNSLVGGMIGASVLVIANLGVARILFKHPALHQRLEGQPIWLIRDGRVLEENLKKEFIMLDELVEAVHRGGLRSLDECEEAIFETSGTITVIAKQRAGAPADTIDARLARIERLLADLSGRPLA